MSLFLCKTQLIYSFELLICFPAQRNEFLQRMEKNRER